LAGKKKGVTRLSSTLHFIINEHPRTLFFPFIILSFSNTSLFCPISNSRIILTLLFFFSAFFLSFFQMDEGEITYNQTSQGFPVRPEVDRYFLGGRLCRIPESFDTRCSRLECNPLIILNNNRKMTQKCLEIQGILDWNATRTVQ